MVNALLMDKLKNPWGSRTEKYDNGGLGNWSRDSACELLRYPSTLVYFVAFLSPKPNAIPNFPVSIKSLTDTHNNR